MTMTRARSNGHRRDRRPAMLLSACAGSSSPTSSVPSTAARPPGRRANPSDVRGGNCGSPTRETATRSTPAQLLYRTYAWTSRGCTRARSRCSSLHSAPRASTCVPDLAESLGTPSADAREVDLPVACGVKFEDGTPVTSRDVKYAVERSLDKSTFPNGRPTSTTFLTPSASESLLQPHTGQAGPHRDRDSGRPDRRLRSQDPVQRVPTTSRSSRRRRRYRSRRTPEPPTRNTWSPAAPTCSRPSNRARG